MAQNEHFERENRLFNATHLKMIIDPKNPPPVPSLYLFTACLKAKTAWDAFEVAEDRLVNFDDDVHTEVLNYISTHRSANNLHLQKQRARFTAQLHETRVAEAHACCRELEMTARALEEAACKEPKTLEAKAALKIDIVVMTQCLSTTRETIGVTEAQLDGARALLNKLEST